MEGGDVVTGGAEGVSEPFLDGLCLSDELSGALASEAAVL